MNNGFNLISQPIPLDLLTFVNYNYSKQGFYAVFGVGMEEKLWRLIRPVMQPTALDRYIL